MTLVPGTRLGHYDVVSLLGSGGMGEVYRARDTRPAMARDVAIKALSGTDVDAAARSRFEQEARATSALNHPNILAIYDVGTHDGLLYLVEELVEGSTLRDLLNKGPLPARKAVEYARAIALGLAAAHAKGIVHRDLKPENVMVTADGRVKILDFGLAKLHQPSPTPDASTRTHQTGPGTILGTVAYMSPEQVRGQTLDARSDLFSLGVVLYEMVSGQRPFSGDTAPDTQAAILNAEPREFSVERAIPTSVNLVIHRCLEKQTEQRFQTASDLAFALGALSSSPSSANAVPSSADLKRRPRGWAGWAATVTAIAAFVSWTAFRPETHQEVPAETRLEISTPPSIAPAAVALSPDGRKVVFSAVSDSGPRLWLRKFDTLTATPLAGTDGGQSPFWSPDSQSLGFFADGKLKRLNADGTVRVIANSPGASSGAAWNPDDVIVFAASALGPLFRVSAAGGSPVQATRLGPLHGAHVQPFFLPDGRHFLFGVNGPASVRGIYVGELDHDNIIRVADVDATTPRVMSERLLFVSGGKLFAQPFDVVRCVTTGPAVQVADSVAGAPGVSAVGAMAFRAGSAVVRRQFVWFDRSGQEVSTVGDVDSANPTNPSMSPDGRLLSLNRTVGGNVDVWTLDVTRGALNRVTSDDGIENFPVWSPDGRELLFGSSRNPPVLDLYRTVLGSSTDVLLLSTGQIKDPEDWSRDGRFVLFRSVDLQTGNDLWALPMAGDRTPLVVARTAFDERGGQFSPDSRWIAYQSDESGRFEIYLQPFPGPGRKIAVSTGGGAQVRWRADGRELFYITLDGRVMAVPVKDVAGTVELGAETPLFPVRQGGAVVFGISRQQYVVSNDGQRFLMNTVVNATPSPLAVILNWKPTP